MKTSDADCSRYDQYSRSEVINRQKTAEMVGERGRIGGWSKLTRISQVHSITSITRTSCSGLSNESIPSRMSTQGRRLVASSTHPVILSFVPDSRASASIRPTS